jgi:hypothetical protein
MNHQAAASISLARSQAAPRLAASSMPRRGGRRPTWCRRGRDWDRLGRPAGLAPRSAGLLSATPRLAGEYGAASGLA